ncbi:MAG: gliding motility protein GldL [Bacteroidetes bacterium]|nr:gliding motility protein GldL [Bacteroidota bacterium]MBL6944435.1 gliding motility protein GldL [Bacteroidales bacterium]
MGIFSFTQTRFYRNFMGKVYGWGASVVLLGALFKINHYPYADIMLIVGLGTEALIFFFAAFEPPHVEPDWSLVHPEFAGMYHGVKHGELKKKKSPTEMLDEMLEKAQIDQAAIERLGSGMEKLSDNALQLNSVADAAVVSEEFYTNLKIASGSASELSYAFGKEVEATNQYSENMQKATEGAGNLASVYEHAAEVVKDDIESTEAFTGTVKAATNSAQSLADSYEKSAEILSRSVSALDFTAVEGDAYNEQLRKISENLSALNAIYEIQLQGTNKTVESSEQLQVTMNEFLGKLEASTASTAEFSGQMDSLTQRMSSLNKVYGNMLSAMNANV